MADDSFKVRHVERLKIKIGEAKNLPTRNHGSSNQRDVYCSLSLDQEEIFRTPTVYQTLSPFFGEEFQFDIPRNFRYISIYVFDRDRQNNKQDKILGKVAIRRENLASYNNKDHWFPIKAVDADSEVQGKANVEIKFVSELQRSKNSNYCTNTRKLVVQVKECRDLTLKNGACDPYALVSVAYSNSKRIEKRTKVRKKTTCPQFEDVFVFNVCEESDVNAEICELLVSLWHDTPGKGDDVFLGEVRVQLTGPQQQKAAHENAWYLLQPRSSRNRPILMHSTPPGTRLSSDNSLGSLRLQVQYTEDRVFPAATYDNLKALILQSLRTQPITNSSVYVLGEIISKIEIAPPLVRILLHSEKVEPIITSLAAVEISKVTDPTTIFRGNTLVSKMMDEAMRLIGLHYLHKTLRPTLDLIFREKKPCEIDPTRVKDLNTIQTNQANLKSYIQRIFDDITQSAVHCPALICKIFHNLKECAILYFPNNKEVRYSVISGFIFLRFFAPAILGPRLFDLTTQAIDCQTNRTLTLISKTIQSLGNLVSCRSSQQVCKEEYMECLYKEFCTETHKTAMRKFLEIISANTSSPRTIVKDKPVILKEGLMIKKSHGRKRFGRKNFKQRYFKLTTQSLSYSKSRGKDALYEMPLSNILAAERVAETSFKMKNMFQIIQPGRVLYVQAANCVDEKEWMDLLTKICQTNANRLRKYHPAAFINGEWMCCKSSNESASGCSEVSNSDCNNHHMSLDPERDLQRIHSLIMSHLPHLETYVTVLGERDSSICNILKKLMEMSYEIERQHRIYKRTMDGNVEKGTLAAPIGDDNYLLASRMNLRGVTTTESSVS
ncbi:GTPase-activating protein [Euwallacea similis]|uniref:GTPase-activating protein n=1 Tax=Euwallacea similis TaxID=1736056 RepID=UPI00344DC62B